jgi:hypothetical protein
VDAAGLQAVTDAAGALQGGSSTFTPAEVQTAYRMVVGSGGIYVFAPTTADGGTVANGAVTVTGGGGFVAFNRTVWNHITAGNLGATVGNLGINVCNVVGHEGVHLLQSMGSGVGANRNATREQRENEARRVRWRC